MLKIQFFSEIQKRNGKRNKGDKKFNLKSDSEGLDFLRKKIKKIITIILPSLFGWRCNVFIL
jgi:hypothetical protein